MAIVSLSLEATAGELLGAFDVSINGPLHQRWSQVDLDIPVDPTPAGLPSDGGGDSPLTPPAGSPFGLGPIETNSKSGSPLTSVAELREYGLGGLRGAWANLNPQRVTNLAYIVVRKDHIYDMDINVVAATPGGSQPYGPFRTWDFFPIPEPARITMIALAMLNAGGLRIRTR